jgi:glycosyltransferase involved in cell wall biosynthesis
MMDGVRIEIRKGDIGPEPFLTVLTRTNKRPKCLKKNIESLNAQTLRDYEQVLIHDDVGMGLRAANKFYMLPDVLDNVRGKYVLLLDDDDKVLDVRFIESMFNWSVKYEPDVIVFRGLIGIPEVGLVPLPRVDPNWQGRPQRCQIGNFCLIVKRDVFMKNIPSFSNDKSSEADFDYIDSIFEDMAGHKFHWDTKIYMSVQQKGYGQPGDRKGITPFDYMEKNW